MKLVAGCRKRQLSITLKTTKYPLFSFFTNVSDTLCH